MNCLTTTELFWLLDADDHTPDLETKISHLVDCSCCKTRLDQLATDHAPPLGDHLAHFESGTLFKERSSHSSEHWLAGLTHLRIIRRIGQGGMGEVYECQDVELGRTVAVKTLRADRLRPELLARHRREALLQASLNHPNIVSVYDFDLSPAGLPYFVMEFVEGRTLADLVRDRSLTASTTVEILLQVARAVAFCHQHQVIHRDLKPSNILLKPIPPDIQHHHLVTQPAWQPKITDFGLARLLQSGLDLTPSQSTIGTPAYLAPESINKAFGEVGTGTDIYALGIMLYECLTGRPPFLAESVAETIRIIQELAPVAPREFNPSLSRDLETICLKCLEKEPTRRYPSALALADDLNRFRNGKPIHARPIGSLGKALRWCGRNRRLTAALATSALSLVLLGSGGLWFAWQQNSLRALSDQRADEARKAQYNAIRYSDLARNNFMASLIQIHQVEGGLRQLANNPSPTTTVKDLWRELARQKISIANAYLNQSLRLGELKGIELDGVFKDAMAMNDIGLRPSAIPILENLRETALKPGQSGPEDYVRMSIGLKSSTMLSVWANEEGRRDHATRLLRQAWHQWPLHLDDLAIPERLLVDRATLDLMYLTIIGPKLFPDEAEAVKAEMAAINARITQRQSALSEKANIPKF